MGVDSGGRGGGRPDSPVCAAEEAEESVLGSRAPVLGNEQHPVYHF